MKVQACGVCHSDAFIKMALFSGISLPRVGEAYERMMSGKARFRVVLKM